MNNQNIFEKLAQDSDYDEFIPLIHKESPREFENVVSKENEEDKNIFESLSEQKQNQSFSFLDVGQQIATKGFQGAIGAYGNTLDAFGLQTKENILPGQKARHQSQSDILDKLNRGEKPSFGELEALSGDEDILPDYARLPTSKDVNEIIEKSTGIGEGKTPYGRIAGRGSEFLGEGLVFPGGGSKGLISLTASGLLGQSIREFGGSEDLATGTEIAGSIIPSMIQGKLAPTGKEAKKLTDAGRSLGLTEKQITPLIQGETKIARLSKLARKGEATKEQFASIKESLGDAYQGIKKKVSNLGNVNNSNRVILETKFTNIRNELAKTVKASPDKEAAIKFIDEAIEKISKNGASPEELINFWQDINKSVKWNSLQGGKKSLTQLKEPIIEVLQNVSPAAAKDFEMTNQLYSKYSQISKKLKPDLVDSFVNKGELLGIIPAGIAFVNGNPWFAVSLAGEAASRYLAKEMLTNPKFQNLGNKLVKNFNQGSLKGVKDLMNNAREFMQRKYPEEDWEFLTSEN